MVDHTVLAHAEILAMKKPAKDGRLALVEGCTMYITLEPCPMCAGDHRQARIPRVVVGSMNPKAGCAGSVMNLLQEPGFNHQVELERNSGRRVFHHVKRILQSPAETEIP